MPFERVLQIYNQHLVRFSVNYLIVAGVAASEAFG
jgi:hypothetical protein